MTNHDVGYFWQELQRYPKLHAQLIEVVSELLRERLGPTSEYVQSLISIQAAYINTNHPDFMANTLTSSNLASNHRHTGPHATSNGVMDPRRVRNGSPTLSVATIGSNGSWGILLGSLFQSLRLIIPWFPSGFGICPLVCSLSLTERAKVLRVRLRMMIGLPNTASLRRITVSSITSKTDRWAARRRSLSSTILTLAAHIPRYPTALVWCPIAGWARWTQILAHHSTMVLDILLDRHHNRTETPKTLSWITSLVVLRMGLEVGYCLSSPIIISLVGLVVQAWQLRAQSMTHPSRFRDWRNPVSKAQTLPSIWKA